MNPSIARLVLFGILIAHPVVAQEVAGMDWGPDAAWRTRAKQIRDQRWQLIRNREFGRLNGADRMFRAPGSGGAPASSATAVSGQLNIPVVPIIFPDLPMAFPGPQYRDALFGTTPPGGRPYTLRTYYEQLSGGRLVLSGQILEPVRAINNATYYENGCNGFRNCSDGGRRFGNLLIATLDSISNRPGNTDVWSTYDNDGPDGRPNSGDDNGEVDFVSFIQPRIDGSCTSVNSPGIWAHRGVMRTWNNNSRYVTKTPRRNAAGQPIPGEFLKVDSYIIQSGVGGADGCTASQIMPPSVVIHESGHAFGLPDLYDTQSNGEGIGEWGVMGTGGWTGPLSPSSYDAWSLNELGWVTIDTLTTTRTITTAPRLRSDTVFLAQLSNPNEYLLIENRQSLESDTTLFRPSNPATGCFGTCRKSPGLLLYLIDQTRIAAGRPNNRINVGRNPGVAIIQADGQNNLEGVRGRNRGDTGDTYPGSTGNTRWSVTSTPAARTNSGAYPGAVVDRIEQLPNQAMRFRFVRAEPSVFSTSQAGTTISVNGASTTRYSEAFAAGDSIALATDSLHPIAAGSRYRFSSWTKGGARVQTFISGATADTVSAGFVTELRMLVTKAGDAPASITASQPGSVLEGMFVVTGTPVTLTVSAPPGVTFAGWSGDSTATDSTFVVPMAKPYQLVATFSGQIIPVSVDGATADLIGTPVLTSSEKIALDYQGNKNGRFDLGDYLALLGRLGLAVPPAVLEAVVTNEKKGQ